jgi:hypothetical protein
MGRHLVRTLSKICHLTSNAVCALLYAISIGVAVGVLVSACTGRLIPAIIAAGVGLVVAMGTFGYAIWRTSEREYLHNF